ncbi:hypothetical protein M231_05383 [Tremella mesenterica]|uniref:CENP-V/GFA domain-containing protein n=1 Tax=Tremella mesenterica TaxID=5217 RepID=A0A4Q1BIG8_TREME|nr:hypothetical protein M231_05383 [Tremella mesenterica]
MSDCMSCRKASGSTHSGNFSVDEKDLQIMGHPKIYVDKGISGKEVYRHFCGDCGSPAYTKTEIPGPVYVKIGLFQVDDVDPPSTHVFAKNLAKWEETYPNTKVLETQ